MQVDRHSLRVPVAPISHRQTLVCDGSERNVQPPLGRRGHSAVPGSCHYQGVSQVFRKTRKDKVTGLPKVNNDRSRGGPRALDQDSSLSSPKRSPGATVLQLLQKRVNIQSATAWGLPGT